MNSSPQYHDASDELKVNNQKLFLPFVFELYKNGHLGLVKILSNNQPTFEEYCKNVSSEIYNNYLRTENNQNETLEQKKAPIIHEDNNHIFPSEKIFNNQSLSVSEPLKNDAFQRINEVKSSSFEEEREQNIIDNLNDEIENRKKDGNNVNVTTGAASHHNNERPTNDELEIVFNSPSSSSLTPLPKTPPPSLKYSLEDKFFTNRSMVTFVSSNSDRKRNFDSLSVQATKSSVSSLNITEDNNYFSFITSQSNDHSNPNSSFNNTICEIESNLNQILIPEVHCSNNNNRTIVDRFHVVSRNVKRKQTTIQLHFRSNKDTKEIISAFSRGLSFFSRKKKSLEVLNVEEFHQLTFELKSFVCFVCLKNHFSKSNNLNYNCYLPEFCGNQQNFFCELSSNSDTTQKNISSKGLYLYFDILEEKKSFHKNNFLAQFKIISSKFINQSTCYILPSSSFFLNFLSEPLSCDICGFHVYLSELSTCNKTNSTKYINKIGKESVNTLTNFKYKDININQQTTFGNNSGDNYECCFDSCSNNNSDNTTFLLCLCSILNFSVNLIFHKRPQFLSSFTDIQTNVNLKPEVVMVEDMTSVSSSSHRFLYKSHNVGCRFYQNSVNAPSLGSNAHQSNNGNTVNSQSSGQVGNGTSNQKRPSSVSSSCSSSADACSSDSACSMEDSTSNADSPEPEFGPGIVHRLRDKFMALSVKDDTATSIISGSGNNSSGAISTCGSARMPGKNVLNRCVSLEELTYKSRCSGKTSTNGQLKPTATVTPTSRRSGPAMNGAKKKILHNNASNIVNGTTIKSQFIRNNSKNNSNLLYPSSIVKDIVKKCNEQSQKTVSNIIRKTKSVETLSLIKPQATLNEDATLNMLATPTTNPESFSVIMKIVNSTNIVDFDKKDFTKIDNIQDTPTQDESASVNNISLSGDTNNDSTNLNNQSEINTEHSDIEQLQLLMPSLTMTLNSQSDINEMPEADIVKKYKKIFEISDISGDSFILGSVEGESVANVSNQRSSLPPAAMTTAVGLAHPTVKPPVPSRLRLPPHSLSNKQTFISLTPNLLTSSITTSSALSANSTVTTTSTTVQTAPFSSPTAISGKTSALTNGFSSKLSNTKNLLTISKSSSSLPLLETLSLVTVATSAATSKTSSSVQGSSSLINNSSMFTKSTLKSIESHKTPTLSVSSGESSVLKNAVRKLKPIQSNNTIKTSSISSHSSSLSISSPSTLLLKSSSSSSLSSLTSSSTTPLSQVSIHRTLKSVANTAPGSISTHSLVKTSVIASKIDKTLKTTSSQSVLPITSLSSVVPTVPKSHTQKSETQSIAGSIITASVQPEVSLKNSVNQVASSLSGSPKASSLWPGQRKLGKSSCESSSTSIVFDFRGKDVKSNVAIRPPPFGSKPIQNRNGNGANRDDDDDDNYTGSHDLPADSGIKFEGEMIVPGKSSLMTKKNKKLSLQFNDSALSQTFEYDKEDESDQEEPDNKHNLSIQSKFLAASSNLSSYTPSQITNDTTFELGVTKHLPIQTFPIDDSPESLLLTDDILPESNTQTFSNSSSASDLLF